MATAVVAQCRSGFEAEAAADIDAVARHADVTCHVDARPLAAYVTAVVEDFDATRWSRALAASPPIFIRSLFAGSGPHSLTRIAGSTASDRVTPIASALEALRNGPAAGVWVEFPDTNEGKALSSLARALTPRLERELSARGILADNTSAHFHAFLSARDTAFVGISDTATGPAWPMGIPRLRMPHGAPSRSTQKLAEALIAFLGAREASLLREGMRAVDLGAAPGGWSWQLARRGLVVTAVDNGPLKGDVAIDPRITHVRSDGFTWRPRQPVEWLVCDIVQSPRRIATLCAEWIARGDAQRAIFNLKLPMRERYAEVMRCKALIGERLARDRIGFELRFRHLYHDREEVTAYLARTRTASRPQRSGAMIPRR